jgi:hypothetical protein
MSHLPLTKPTYFSIELFISPPNAHRHASVLLHVPYADCALPSSSTAASTSNSAPASANVNASVNANASALPPLAAAYAHARTNRDTNPRHALNEQETLDTKWNQEVLRNGWMRALAHTLVGVVPTNLLLKLPPLDLPPPPASSASAGMSQGITDDSEPKGGLDSSTNPQRRRGSFPLFSVDAYIPTLPIYSHPLYCSILHPYRQPHRW